jgi:hypothetical protein
MGAQHATRAKRAPSPAACGNHTNRIGPWLRPPDGLDILFEKRLAGISCKKPATSFISLIRTATLASAGVRRRSDHVPGPGFSRAGGLHPPSSICHHCGGCSALCTYAGPPLRAEAHAIGTRAWFAFGSIPAPLPLSLAGGVAMAPGNNATSTAVPSR